MDGRSDFGVRIPQNIQIRGNIIEQPDDGQPSPSSYRYDSPRDRVRIALDTLTDALHAAADGLGHSTTGRALHRAADATNDLREALALAGSNSHLVRDDGQACGPDG